MLRRSFIGASAVIGLQAQHPSPERRTKHALASDSVNISNFLRGTARTQSFNAGAGKASLVELEDTARAVTGRTDLKLAWVTLPSASIKIYPRKVAPKWSELPFGLPDDIAAVNGPQIRDPELLLYSAPSADIRHKARPRLTASNSGGFLIRTPTGLAIRRTKEPGYVDDALTIIQSDVLLVEDGNVAIYGDKTNDIWNRTAIGLGAAGELVIIGVFAADCYAFTLKQFADAIRELKTAQGIDVRWALNMDGAFASFISVPPLLGADKCFGTCSLMHVGSTIHFLAT